VNGSVRRWLIVVLLGSTAALRAQDKPPPPPVDTNTSPYHLALLAYKGGRYDEALQAINAAEKAAPDDVPTEILKARILTEQLDFAGGEALLKKVIASNGGYDAQIALGDLYLRQHNFPGAVQTYNLCLAQKPNDPDLLLSLIYALIGADDYVTAGKYFSQLKPFDPDYPSYYFAKAAFAQASGKGSEIDQDLETVRTIYGSTTANRYLKTYLQIFISSGKNFPASRAEPPSTNAPPETTEKKP
jgi:tetratricopeptide (TPR) repeat protein